MKDAAKAGYSVTKRLIWDWTSYGLLDGPRRRSQGKGHGSHPALYPSNQRHLLLTLLHHRSTMGIRGLAQIPVGIWVYWGDSYVPLRQAKLAFRTWLGDPRVSQRAARMSAAGMIGGLDNPAATRTAHAALLDVLTAIAYTGRVERELLRQAVHDVFEPDSISIHRALGHPEAPLTTEAIVDLITAQVVAAGRVTNDRLTDDEFGSARSMLLQTQTEYQARQPIYARSTPSHLPAFYEEPTWESRFNRCCGELLAIIGLRCIP